MFVARQLGPADFGAFALAFATYLFALNASRGLATDPLVVRFSGVPVERWRDAVARSSGTALAVGVVAGAVSVLVGGAIGGTLGFVFVALGAVLPMLLLQDAWRFAFFAAGQGRLAFVNDVVWALAMIPAMVLASQYGSVVAFLLAWGCSAGVAAVYGCVQTGTRPRWTGVSSWLREQGDLGPRYLVENVSNSGSSQLRMYGLGAIAGVADVGTVRGAELLMGPFLAVLQGLSFVSVPEGARVLRRNPRRLPLFCLALGGGQAVGTLLWGTVLLVLVNDRLGTFVLGPVWHTASALILPLTLGVTNASFITGAAAGLRALGAARRSMQCQLIASTAYVVGGLAGAALGGALGSAWGVVCATFFGAIVWWTQLRAGLRAYLRTPADLPVSRDESRTT